MEAELILLASTGATTVVALMATDAWEQARTVVAGLWHRVSPEQAPVVEAELLTARDLLTAAGASGDELAVAGTLAVAWQARLTLLLAADPRVAVEVRRMLDDELRPILDAAGRAVMQTPGMHARASGHARVYQAGRDMRITEQ